MTFHDLFTHSDLKNLSSCTISIFTSRYFLYYGRFVICVRRCIIGRNLNLFFLCSCFCSLRLCIMNWQPTLSLTWRCGLAAPRAPPSSVFDAAVVSHLSLSLCLCLPPPRGRSGGGGGGGSGLGSGGGIDDATKEQALQTELPCSLFVA